MHPPASAAAVLRQVAYLGMGEDLCPVPHRIRQVGERNRVLGAHVAAPATVTAQRAGGLRDAGQVDAFYEVHRYRGRDGLHAEPDTGGVKRLPFAALMSGGIARRP